MNRTRLIAAVALSALAAPAAAADFTFDVPVRVQNVPSMHTLYLSCSVWTAYPDDRLVGRGSSPPIPTTGGSYEGTVTIEVNATGITPAAEARVYNCALEGSGTALTGSTYRSSPDNFRAVYERATGHTLVTATNQVRGTLP